jgi:hypothetical protein
MLSIIPVPDLGDPFAPTDPEPAEAHDVRDPPPHGPPG